MENLEIEEDPVVQEVRDIRNEIAAITKGFNDEELLAWYRAEAQEALAITASLKKKSTKS